MKMEALRIDQVPNNTIKGTLPSAITPEILIPSIIYGILFTVGATGNGWVIFLLVCIMANKTRQGSRHIQVLVLSLSIVDTLVLSCIPVILLGLYQAAWYGGNIFCKIYWMCENLNKILSTFLLLLLSLFCFVGTRKPYAVRKYDNSCTGIIGCLIFTALAIILMIPLYEFSEVKAIIYRASNNTTYYLGEKCLFDPPEGFLVYFSAYTFAICFCIPTILQGFFYASVLWFVHSHVNQVAHTVVPIWRVTRKAITLMTVYIICWVPYWSVTLYQVILPAQVNPTIYILSMAVHILPFLNAAINPMLYTYLNKSLRLQTRTINSAFAHNRYRFSSTRWSMAVTGLRSYNGVCSADGTKPHHWRKGSMPLLQKHAVGSEDGRTIERSLTVKRANNSDVHFC